MRPNLCPRLSNVPSLSLCRPNRCGTSPLLAAYLTQTQGRVEHRVRAGAAAGERHPPVRDRLLALHGGGFPQQDSVRGGYHCFRPALLGSVLPDRPARRLDPGR